MLFFLFLVVLTFCFTSSVDNENVSLRVALAILTGIPITVANDAIEMLPLLQIKQLRIYQNNQKKQYIC